MDAYLVSIGIVVFIYALLAIGLNLQYGETGLINFGHVAFFAIGAYTSALLALNGVPLWLSFPAAGIAAALAAVPLGMAALRLREDYLAIVTLGFSESIRLAIQQEEWLTRGVQGIPGVPALFASASGSTRHLMQLATLAGCTCAAILAIRMLQKSPFGRLLRAIRDNEPAVTAIGKDPAGYKIRVFMLGAALAGIAGAFYAHFVTFITPEQFVPLVTFYVWMSIILGGVGSMRGALFGTLILVVFLEGSRFLRDVVPGIEESQMAHIRLGVIGMALILCMLFRPQGIFGKRGQ